MRISPNGLIPDDNYSPVTIVVSDGWTNNAPGFDRVVDDEPENDVYRMQSGANIWLVVVAMDPALQLIDQGFQILDSPGEETELGDHNLHLHNTWKIKSTHPEYDPEQCVWHGTFFLRDYGSTNYDDSDHFTYNFSNVPVRYVEDDPIPPATGDLDADESVDLDDHSGFAECMAGVGARPDPYLPGVTTCEVECLNAFDFDNDQDVDLIDFAEFQVLFGG
jgi:hypothetical protein